MLLVLLVSTHCKPYPEAMVVSTGITLCTDAGNFVTQGSSAHSSTLSLQGWVVQPGADYGADYVLYDSHPSEAHSSYCVLALTGSKRPECIRWTDIEAVSRVCSQVGRCEEASVLNTCVLCLLH